MEKIKVGVYIRVSTKEQAKNGFGKDLQLTKIKKFIEYNFDKGYEFDEDLVYKDLGISGAKDDLNRPGLKKLKDDIKAKKIDVVVVYKLDRLARKTKIILELVDFFNMYDVSFVSTIENIDTSSTTGKFFLTILGAIGEMERDLLAEKSQEGIIEGLKQGIYTIGGNISYGFSRNDEKAKVGIIEKEAKIIRYIFDLFLKENKSLNQISEILKDKKILPKHDEKGLKRSKAKNYGKWYPSTISAMLSNEAYIGIVWLNKTKYIDSIIQNEFGVDIKDKKRGDKEKEDWIALEVESIVETEIFHKAQKKLLSNPFRNNNKNKPIINHLFSPFIKCGVCGSNYKGDKGKPNKEGIYKPYYRCGRTNKSKHGEDRCTNSQIRESELIENIFNEINKYFKNPKLIMKRYIESSNNEKENDRYLEELEENKKIIENNLEGVEIFFNKLIKESNTTFKAIIEKNIDISRKSVENLEKRNEKLKGYILNNKKIIRDKEAFEKYIEEYKGKNIYNYPRKEQVIILEKILREVVVFKDDINVVLFFKDTASFIENENNKKPEDNHKGLNSGCFSVNGGRQLKTTTH